MRKTVFTLILLASLLFPIVHAVTIDGPLNFVGPHTGIVRFNPQIRSTYITVVNGIPQYTRFTLNGVNRGVMGFDAGPGVNMTVLRIGDRSVVYNVSCVGVGVTYVFYNRMTEAPQSDNVDSVTFNEGTGIATVTTTGSVVVTLTYHNVSNLLTRGLLTYVDFMPIVFILLGLHLRRESLIDNRMFLYVLVLAAAAFVIAAIRGMGF